MHCGMLCGFHTQVSLLIILKSLQHFGFGIHHEGSHPCNGLLDGCATENHKVHFFRA